MWQEEGYTGKYRLIPKGNQTLQYFLGAKGILHSTQYTPLEVYGLIVNENNEVYIWLMIGKNDIMSMLGLDSGYTV